MFVCNSRVITLEHKATASHGKLMQMFTSAPTYHLKSNSIRVGNKETTTCKKVRRVTSLKKSLKSKNGIQKHLDVFRKTCKHHHDSTCHMPCMTRTMVNGMLHSESKLHFAMTSMSILETQRALEAPDMNARDLLEIGTELSPALEEVYISSNC